jgi:hypothetical protein
MSQNLKSEEKTGLSNLRLEWCCEVVRVRWNIADENRFICGNMVVQRNKYGERVATLEKRICDVVQNIGVARQLGLLPDSEIDPAGSSLQKQRAKQLS